MLVYGGVYPGVYRRGVYTGGYPGTYTDSGKSAVKRPQSGIWKSNSITFNPQLTESPRLMTPRLMTPRLETRGWRTWLLEAGAPGYRTLFLIARFSVTLFHTPTSTPTLTPLRNPYTAPLPSESCRKLISCLQGNTTKVVSPVG